MPIFRVERTSNYTVMSNHHLKEKDMSLKAKGLLSIMLSLPENWDYTILGLVSICKENESSIKSALDELKKFGYLRIDKYMPNETSSGRIEYEYIIFEKPNFEEKQEGKKQGVENLGVENQPQLNTNKQITNKLNKNRDIALDIFNFWNEKQIICHKELTEKIEKQILTALKSNTVDEIKTYISRYNEVIKDKSFYFDTKWTLIEFLKQSNAMNDFKDDGSKWVNYKDTKPKTAEEVAVEVANKPKTKHIEYYRNSFGELMPLEFED